MDEVNGVCVWSHGRATRRAKPIVFAPVPQTHKNPKFIWGTKCKEQLTIIGICTQETHKIPCYMFIDTLWVPSSQSLHCSLCSAFEVVLSMQHSHTRAQVLKC
jgi:hypothetical protein